MKKLLWGFLLLFLCVSKVEGKTLYTELYKNATPDNRLSEYVTSPTGINFNSPSSSTNGRGLYIISSTLRESYPILYFRGNIENNYVIFHNYCWQIIRSTEEGAIKVMYAGTPTNNHCNNELGNLTIGKSPYNDSNNTPKYGWTYYEGEEKDSLAKTYLDNWFYEYMISEQENLEDVIWCNDRRKSGTYFDAVTRLESGTPDLSCEKEDSYTVENEFGNQLLKYPVGIITGDEITYAGENIYQEANDSFININYSYWSMTPYSENKNMYPNSKGMLNRYTFTYSAGIRPMIALKGTTTIESGNGTRNNPYILSIQKRFENPETKTQ